MKTRPRLIGLLVLLVLAGVAGYAYVGQTSTAEPGSGAPIAEVVVPELDAAAQEGKAAYQESCTSCHGDNAAGQEGVAPPLVHPIYEPGHHGDASFHMAAQNGARSHHWPFGDMPPVEDVTQSDVDKILTYVRTLQRANGIK